MYYLSGITGGISILFGILLVFELLESPLIGDPLSRGPDLTRSLVFGVLSAGFGFASMKFHRRLKLGPAPGPSPRLKHMEGMAFTFMGAFLLLGALFWGVVAGGAYGWHVILFLFGVLLTLIGLRRLHPRE
jgi:hypothetical protein